MTIRTPTALLVIALLLVAPSAFAWGRSGHRIVAKIAAKNLSPGARMKVAAILGTNDAGVDDAMARAATWPDEIDRASTGSAGWHFINVPVAGPFTVTGFCPGRDCVTDRIEEMLDRLRTNRTGFALLRPPSPPRPMTSQELAFLIHFVGDIHQPLHAAINGDRGGNCVNLTSALIHSDGSLPTTQLHALWDVDAVNAVLRVLGGEDATATKLFQRFKGGAPVEQLTAAAWARQSNDLARSEIYQKLRIANRTAPPGQCAPGIAKVTVPPSYLDGNIMLVEQQLMRAGIRLSNLVNQACAGNGCLANPVARR